jgi:formate hydrogenlyase subunit 3/multisubunit Na+/H+ antiporter MnhD subunit
MGKTLATLALLGLLGAAIWVAVVGWTLGDEPVEVTGHGYAAMALGILFSLVVGCGLMALIFYSSRTGHDEPPRRVIKDE